MGASVVPAGACLNAHKALKIINHASLHYCKKPSGSVCIQVQEWCKGVDGVEELSSMHLLINSWYCLWWLNDSVILSFCKQDWQVSWVRLFSKCWPVFATSLQYQVDIRKKMKSDFPPRKIFFLEEIIENFPRGFLGGFLARAISNFCLFILITYERLRFSSFVIT